MAALQAAFVRMAVSEHQILRRSDSLGRFRVVWRLRGLHLVVEEAEFIPEQVFLYLFCVTSLLDQRRPYFSKGGHQAVAGGQFYYFSFFLSEIPS